MYELYTDCKFYSRYVGNLFRLPKSCFQGGVGSGESFSFWQCSVCLRRRSIWAMAELFFFLLSFLSHSLEIHAWPSKKQLCPPVCDFIDFDPLSFIIVYFILEHFIQFYYLSDLVPILLVALFMYFYTFLDYYFNFNFVSSNCIAFVFLIYFLSLIFWFLCSYPLLDLSSFFQFLSLNI
jgi:hypothetical protein